MSSNPGSGVGPCPSEEKETLDDLLPYVAGPTDGLRLMALSLNAGVVLILSEPAMDPALSFVLRDGCIFVEFANKLAAFCTGWFDPGLDGR